jgi:hypothetical protein
MDREEFVTLTDHGTMKLRSAVARAMMLSAKERKGATIVREGEPASLNFKQIKNLAAQWDERLVPINRGPPSIASPAAKAATTSRRQRPHIRKGGTGTVARTSVQKASPIKLANGSSKHNSRMPHKSKPADKKSGHKRSLRRTKA